MRALKMSFAYTMKVGDKVVCTATSTHCFIENNRPGAIEKRFPELYKKIRETIE
jgi:acyl-CoA thioesterase FadM